MAVPAVADHRESGSTGYRTTASRLDLRKAPGSARMSFDTLAQVGELSEGIREKRLLLSG